MSVFRIAAIAAPARSALPVSTTTTPSGPTSTPDICASARNHVKVGLDCENIQLAARGRLFLTQRPNALPH